MKNLSQSPPVFLIGPVRSGSTLIRLMLNSHPKICNPGEFDFLFDIVGESGQFPDSQTYCEWLSMDRSFRLSQLKADPDLTYQQLVNSFLSQVQIEDKLLALNIHRNFDRIPYVFPTARYIRILRDPRDVARSCVGMGWEGHVYYGVNTWITAEKSWEQLKTALATDQYMEIKYEDLINDVQSGLSRICNFLGLDYSSQMLNYASASTYGPPDTNLSYQWKKKYTKRELQLVEGKLGKWLVDLGYEPGGYGQARPGFWEAVVLAYLNKKRRVSFQINRYGLKLYAMIFLAKRRMGTKQWQSAVKLREHEVDNKLLKGFMALGAAVLFEMSVNNTNQLKMLFS